MEKTYLVTILIFIFYTFEVSAQNDEVIIQPEEYDRALRNPLKGFTTNNISDHPWGTLAHTYFKWNELENHESDGIEKIISVSNQRWNTVAAKNIKVIPRVYLHWDGDKKYWPADMEEDDYSSEQFQKRVVRLVKRLGACWDNDPRVAFVELGIIGKWGEHHSPGPSTTQQKLLGDAFAEAFNNKKVSVRHFWNHFTDYPFGEYWDSWAHYDQMWGHGNSIKQVNDQTGRYKETYIGGEVAYGWGNNDIQAGPSPTHSVAIEKHRNFVINSIRWLHCTQLRWISNYDKNNAQAQAGAEEMQKAFGYRYVLDEVRFSLEDSLNISFDVSNTGSAPFYYDWPVELALLDSSTHEPVWKATMDSADIRVWMPGENWTDPEWKYVGSWQEYHPNENWNSSGITGWATPPAKNRVEGKFEIDLPDGTYILSLSILDPAGNLPSVKFATGNYLKGGKHPMGLVYVGENKCDTLPSGFQFDDPRNDNSLKYEVDFEIVYEEDSVERDPVRTPYKGNVWRFPTDNVPAWQYDFMNNHSGDKYFSLDTANTIGIYGCNDTIGYNIRSYKDSVQNADAAQFKWDQTSETFQKNGQWLEYTAGFQLNLPYQLLIRARNDVDARFRLTILTNNRDTVFFNDFSIEDDFKNVGGGNEQTDWFRSKNQMDGLWGAYIIRFDWYDNVGEPGIFGGFSFAQSELDFTPPEWYYVSLGTFNPGTNIVVMTTEDATVYMVPEGTPADTTSIKEAAVSNTETTAYSQANLSTTGLSSGEYVLYAVDSSGNVSVASSAIRLENPVNAALITDNSKTTVFYDNAYRLIKIKSSNELGRIEVYNILGKKVGSKKCDGKTDEIQTAGLIAGVYLVHVFDKNETLNVKKVFLK
ncbi:DUF4832 domain-containing protein [Mariniphaga sp.]|uniref:DUF4832 domain-containing protein n=1 Tax=Mariniphaga sp. TaxID=1954475 RepID=UPI003561B779